MQGVNLDGADGIGVAGSRSRQGFGGGESETGQEGSPIWRRPAGSQRLLATRLVPSGQQKRGRGATQPAADKACSTIRISRTQADEWVMQLVKDNQLYQHGVVDQAVELLKKQEGLISNPMPPIALQ
eukprot:jgi/Tetstr1/432076/TSEL_021547.t1